MIPNWFLVVLFLIIELYNLDKEIDFLKELVHLKTIVQNILSEAKNNLTSLLRKMKTSSIDILFPNIDIILRIICTLSSSNARGSRSFPVLKLVNNYLRSL
jgi:hypothetical protein